MQRVYGQSKKFKRRASGRRTGEKTGYKKDEMNY